MKKLDKMWNTWTDDEIIEFECMLTRVLSPSELEEYRKGKYSKKVKLLNIRFWVY